MVQHDKRTLERMINGDLPWDELKPIISGRKDPNRFEIILEILQERVSWNEKILLPLHEHLYVVSKEVQRIVKCDCGYEGKFKYHHSEPFVLDRYYFADFTCPSCNEQYSSEVLISNANAKKGILQRQGLDLEILKIDSNRTKNYF